jgi:hypothetical protein
MLGFQSSLSIIIAAFFIWYGKKETYPFSSKNLEDYKIYLEFVRTTVAQPFYTNIFTPLYDILYVEVSSIELIAKGLSFLVIVTIIYTIISLLVRMFIQKNGSASGNEPQHQHQMYMKPIYKSSDGAEIRFE